MLHTLPGPEIVLLLLLLLLLLLIISVQSQQPDGPYPTQHNIKHMLKDQWTGQKWNKHKTN